MTGFYQVLEVTPGHIAILVASTRQAKHLKSPATGIFPRRPLFEERDFRFTYFPKSEQ